MAKHAARSTARRAPLPELAGLLAARRTWLRRHALVATMTAAAVVLLAVVLVIGAASGMASTHPGALVLDAALIGVLLSLFAGSVANAWSAWRFGARIAGAGAAVPCRVRRLGPETHMRKDYLLLTAGRRSALVRCAEDAPTGALAEVIDGSVLGWPARRGSIVLMLPHVGPVAATVGRYHRHLPKALRADFSTGRLAASD